MELNNILFAECSLLTVISILIGLWHGDIVNALNTEIINSGPMRIDYDKTRKKIRHILWLKVFLIMMLSITSSMIFMPASIDLMGKISSWKECTVELSVIFVSIVNTIIAILFIRYFVASVIKLHKK